MTDQAQAAQIRQHHCGVTLVRRCDDPLADRQAFRGMALRHMRVEVSELFLIMTQSIALLSQIVPGALEVCARISQLCR